MRQSKPLVFFGSGPLGAATLRHLSDSTEISAVITKPQSQHGHKTLPPVIETANQLGLPLHTPTNKRELGELFESDSSLTKLCGVVVDYGIIIPDTVIDHFEFGIVNSHFSLLPKWRGPDPISFPILNGDSQTGVSLMLIVPALDEGDIIAQVELTIDPADTSASLTQKLIDLSNKMYDQYLPNYLEGGITPHPQDPTVTPSYSSKLTKADGLVDWSKPADQLEREVRAYSGWPKSYTTLLDKDIIITEASTKELNGQAGEAFITEDGQLGVYCGAKSLIIKTLTVSGKGSMDGKSFIAGYGKSLSD